MPDFPVITEDDWQDAINRERHHPLPNPVALGIREYAVRSKIEENAKKYPVARSKGNSKKYDRL